MVVIVIALDILAAGIADHRSLDSLVERSLGYIVDSFGIVGNLRILAAEDRIVLRHTVRTAGLDCSPHTVETDHPVEKTVHRAGS